MKVALTVWENRISPLFDCARTLLIVDITDQTETGRYFEPFHCESPSSRAARLSDLKVQVLICGAVSDVFANMIETHGIRIVPFVAGAIDEVIDAYLTGALSSSKFQMPGCGTERDNGYRKEKNLGASPQLECWNDGTLE